jgi:hypothetical protein
MPITNGTVTTRLATRPVGSMRFPPV